MIVLIRMVMMEREMSNLHEAFLAGWSAVLKRFVNSWIHSILKTIQLIHSYTVLILPTRMETWRKQWWHNHQMVECGFTSRQNPNHYMTWAGSTGGQCHRHCLWTDSQTVPTQRHHSPFSIRTCRRYPLLTHRGPDHCWVWVLTQ